MKALCPFHACTCRRRRAAHLFCPGFVQGAVLTATEGDLFLPGSLTGSETPFSSAAWLSGPGLLFVCCPGNSVTGVPSRAGRSFGVLPLAAIGPHVLFGFRAGEFSFHRHPLEASLGSLPLSRHPDRQGLSSAVASCPGCAGFSSSWGQVGGPCRPLFCLLFQRWIGFQPPPKAGVFHHAAGYCRSFRLVSVKPTSRCLLQS